ncbi:Protein 21.1 [Giardia lamblia P15]|uniref:Protein 21.1 n=1 Tax=Giardia intestinalis (strain P15) TaxID=658858 RepID=E1F141_GIAIA|nr:Protein 21.1 [Giardia lamblia P15]
MARNERGGSRAGSSGQEDVEAGPQPTRDSSSRDSSWTPLMHAAADGDIEAVKKHLLEDKGKKNSDGDTALIIAARAKHKDIVELLDPTDKDGVTALMRAADRNDLPTARALAPLQRGQKASGNVKIGEVTIDKGGTALMMAAARGHAKIVELLVGCEGGARVGGWSALVFAARSGCSGIRLNDPLVDHPRCVELLVEYESNISGWTELIHAAYRGDISAARNNLRMKGRRDASGWTALMYAAARGHERIVELLREESGIQNNTGQTALMWAARNGHPECVRLLLEKESEMRNTKGWTALMNAVWGGHIECVKLLLGERELRTVYDYCDYPRHTTALDIAEKKGHKEIVDILSS